MTSLFRYHAFGLDFQSALPLPELRASGSANDDAVTIALDDAPCPAGLVSIIDGVAAGPRDFWMEVPGVARLHVVDGSTIRIDAAPGADMADIRAYLLGSAAGALLYQRGRLPLHASAVLIDDVAVAFCGPSGAGKSSLAHALVMRGHRLLCDDIAAVDTSTGTPMLWPGLVTLKLWEDRIAAVSESTAGLQPVLRAADKYLRPVDTLAPHGAHRLGHIITLSAEDEGPPVMTPMKGSTAAALLVSNSFRGQLVKPMHLCQTHFAQCTKLAENVGIWTLARPWSHEEMTATCAAIESAVTTS